MKERIKSLNGERKVMLTVFAVLLTIFTILYCVAAFRKGYAYCDELFLPREEGENTVWSGKLYGAKASFTVMPNNTVRFVWNNKTWDLYTVTEDPSAVPKSMTGSRSLQGIVVRCGEKVIFRGGMERGEAEGHKLLYLYMEDGTPYWEMSVSAGYDENAAERLVEPDVYTILDLLGGPSLSRRGNWLLWFVGAFTCIMGAVHVLYADEIFRWNMKLTLRSAEGAEPTELYAGSRFILWIAWAAVSFFAFIKGLQLIQ